MLAIVPKTYKFRVSCLCLRDTRFRDYSSSDDGNPANLCCKPELEMGMRLYVGGVMIVKLYLNKNDVID